MQAASLNLKTVFGDLVRIETRLYNAVNDRLRARHGLFASQFEFLSYLRNHPKSRVADLAAYFAIGVGATSKGIDRLEAQDLVRRLPNPEDGRSSLLELTETGAAQVDTAERTLDEHLVALFGAAIDPARCEQFADAVALLRRFLEQENIGTPAG
ncbi:MarR family winged helix-turn-helix transcriptional regulator [Paraburkholderia flava]|uniref:MarR family winged helix-turn-helix transcriptional regulator n=1 Tax=Paraburkholderia flava TaxID=2547393 RepID=UPI001061E519|nr:MarR family winged helix-turn-helix transcriptional regulator [Paraburkholderia flava]